MSFFKAVGWGAGIYVGVALAIVAIPVLVCGGCMVLVGGGLGVAGHAASEAEEARRRVEARHAKDNSPAPAVAIESRDTVLPAEPSVVLPEEVTPPIADVPQEPDLPADPVVPAPAPPDTLPRTWTTVDGKFSTEATFLYAAGGTVKLRKADGAEISVPLDRLSDADREWIDKRKGGR